MIPPRLMLVLVVAGLLLPIAVVVLYGVAGLLAALGDGTCGQIARIGALVVGLVWVVDLVCLVLALGVKAVTEKDSP